MVTCYKILQGLKGIDNDSSSYPPCLHLVFVFILATKKIDNDSSHHHHHLTMKPLLFRSKPTHNRARHMVNATTRKVVVPRHRCHGVAQQAPCGPRRVHLPKRVDLPFWLNASDDVLHIELAGGFPQTSSATDSGPKMVVSLLNSHCWMLCRCL